MTTARHSFFKSIQTDLRPRFASRAPAVDRGDTPAHDSLPFLAEHGLLSKGVVTDLGGDGGDLTDMIEVIATVASECMTSAFVLWSHRALIGLIAAADNAHLHRHVLPELLNVNKYGATGLADGVRYAAGIGDLRLRAKPGNAAGSNPNRGRANLDGKAEADLAEGRDCVVSGFVPWATNLVGNRFAIAIAAQTAGKEFLVGVVPGDSPGVTCQPAPPLLALDGSASGSLQFDAAPLPAEWILSENGAAFLADVRPAFLLLQCGLPWGIAAAALDEIRSTRLVGDKQALVTRRDDLQREFDALVEQIRGLGRRSTYDKRDFYFIVKARKRLSELAMAAVGLELETAGGSGYTAAGATARRWREAAFLPLQTPTLAQLQMQLDALEGDLCETHLTDEAQTMSHPVAPREVPDG